MPANDLIIDLDFGLRQLSGNRELLYRLLNKFATEYQNLSSRMDTMLEKEDLSSAEILIHTLKGVSGNLGCNRVFESSRIVNEQVKLGAPDSDSLQLLYATLNETLEEIKVLTGEEQPSPVPAPKVESKQTHSKSALINALTHHEYINDEKLKSWLTDLNLEAKQEESLVEAIMSLDYEHALKLLEQASV